MTFVLYLLGLLLVSAVALAVSAPLFSYSAEQAPLPEPEDETVRWEKQKADAYSAIKEAEFDQQMGKLTDEDYRILREKYETRALEALAQLDRIAAARNSS
ncbi:MAG: hypothetical protein FJ147_12250 [Deltaproteobacteria bacterium]|nr:hypothetical protein [Deltaproteobacteria bacterium]